MYFVDNNKSTISVNSGSGHFFPYPEFSRAQHWVEVGQRMQKIFFLYLELDKMLTNVESEHGPIRTSRVDKSTGYKSTTNSKSISQFVDPEHKKYICRLIFELYKDDLHEIVVINRDFKNLRAYINLKQKDVLYGNPLDKKKIVQYFDYITLNSLKEELIDFYQSVRKIMDDKTNEIVIPKAKTENYEFYHYFISARESYFEDDKEIALAIMRKGLEDILTRLWILHFEDPLSANLKKRDNLDNLPGILKSKKILSDQELREILPLIKYGNSGIHVRGDISKKDIEANSRNKLNDGISIINSLTEKYAKLMRENKWGRMDLKKDGFSVGTGILYNVPR